MATPDLCAFDGCSNPVRYRGYCNKHYQNLRYHGRLPESAPRRRTPSHLLDEFIAAAIASETDECILWPFQKNHYGHAYRHNQNGSNKVHVVVCEARHGPKPDVSLVAAHECLNGKNGCINPRHLSWKTQLENVHDAIRHGTWAHGEGVGGARFKEHEIMEIRRRWASGESQSSIGRYFGVAQGHIHRIITGQTWKHLPVLKRGA